MKLRNYSLILFCSIQFLTGCSAGDDVRDQLQEIFDNEENRYSEVLENKSLVMIIPRTGCSSCIGIADYLFKQSEENSKVQFIFTRISSLKAMKIKFGDQKLNRNNVQLDRIRQFSLGALDSMYPIVAFLTEGKIVDVDFISLNSQSLVEIITQEISAN